MESNVTTIQEGNISVIDAANSYLIALGQNPITNTEILQLELMDFHLLEPSSEHPCEAVTVTQTVLYLRQNTIECFSYNKLMLSLILEKTGCPFIPNPLPAKGAGFFVGGWG